MNDQQWDEFATQLAIEDIAMLATGNGPSNLKVSVQRSGTYAVEMQRRDAAGTQWCVDDYDISDWLAARASQCSELIG